MSYQGEKPKVHVCDGCSSWTNEPVTLDVLLSDAPGGWAWTEGADKDDGGGSIFCPECS